MPPSFLRWMRVEPSIVLYLPTSGTLSSWSWVEMQTNRRYKRLFTASGLMASSQDAPSCNHKIKYWILQTTTKLVFMIVCVAMTRVAPNQHCLKITLRFFLYTHTFLSVFWCNVGCVGMIDPTGCSQWGTCIQLCKSPAFRAKDCATQHIPCITSRTGYIIHRGGGGWFMISQCNIHFHMHSISSHLNIIVTILSFRHFLQHMRVAYPRMRRRFNEWACPRI